MGEPTRDADVEVAAPAFAATVALLLQWETAADCLHRAAQMARDAGALIILNPAPARAIPGPLWTLRDILVHNEVGATMLLGFSADDPVGAAHTLLAQDTRAVVVTLGAQGALLVTPQIEQLFAPYKVKVIDRVAAGDAFRGALAVCLAEGAPCRRPSALPMPRARWL